MTNHILVPAYKEKTDSYYGTVRHDVIHLIPSPVERLLDVGCGSGATASFLKERGYCKRAIGIELFPDAAATARQKIDEVYQGNIEDTEFPIAQNSIDLLLCLDVLEHLVDPWSALKRLVLLLRQDGVLIASIPNIRHWRVPVGLLVSGSWHYTDQGALDRTHLRFFVRDTAVGLIKDAGLSVEVIQPRMGKTGEVFSFISLKLLEPLLAGGYLIRARNNK